MKIVALKYGESVFGENYIFKSGRKDVLLPISFTIYLIQTEYPFRHRKIFNGRTDLIAVRPLNILEIYKDI